MPSNENFTLSILIGGTTVPEYTRNGIHYVECNLSTPVSYKLSETDIIAGEIEKQEWPVTPYSVKIETHNLDEVCYFRLLVDGVKVKAVSLGPNAVSIIKGFRDGSVIREFLFSMPRFAKDSDDRLEPGRESNVGCIEVECWKAVLRSSNWKSRRKPLNFQQANKKDVYRVTSGQYTMVTSKVGKPVSHRSVLRKVDSWKLTELRSSLKLHYRMGHTLHEMGFTLKPCQITKPINVYRQETHTSDVKQEDNRSTQVDDVIKIDDDNDNNERRPPLFIDLTGDSDDDMQSNATLTTAETSGWKTGKQRVSDSAEKTVNDENKSSEVTGEVTESHDTIQPIRREDQISDELQTENDTLQSMVIEESTSGEVIVDDNQENNQTDPKTTSEDVQKGSEIKELSALSEKLSSDGGAEQLVFMETEADEKTAELIEKNDKEVECSDPDKE